jgi:murein L,D-transpeptidase YafK
MKLKRIHILYFLLALCLIGIPFRRYLQREFIAVIQQIKGKKTVSDRVTQYSDVVHERLNLHFQKINVSYPPTRLTLVGIKDQKKMEVWVAGKDKKFRLLRIYPILGMSGELGPKLKEGDGQVPEGLYRIESLNPNSSYHLALRVNYPNDYDKEKGKADNRKNLGSDIMIHGNTCSIGCLAMGDETAEDLFVLAAETGIDNVSVILTPTDFRIKEATKDLPQTPEWTAELYEKIKVDLKKLK